MLREISFGGFMVSQFIVWIDVVRTPKFSLIFLIGELLCFGFILIWGVAYHNYD